MLTDELLCYLFDGQSHSLAPPMAAWLGSSRRFTVFVNTFRDKIRKKLRVTRDQETLYDLRLELETAYLLLQERNLSLAYEPEQAGPGRSPDFAVTFTTSLTFMVEVTRLRGGAKGSLPISDHGFAPGDERFADAIYSKLRQLLPQRSNVLIIGVDVLLLRQEDLQNMMLRLQQRAEARDSILWQRYGFRDRSDIIRNFQRLSEVLVRGSRGQADHPSVVWVNPQAKHPLPSKVRTSLYRSHAIKA
ncbi:MAG TPA: hypothetical protein VFG81_19440 [Anaerolineales bacterium]|jgi:hypothetical protein|nr:hypothetical protein [Anaerolineales bacterium]